MNGYLVAAVFSWCFWIMWILDGHLDTFIRLFAFKLLSPGDVSLCVFLYGYAIGTVLLTLFVITS